MQGHLGFLFSVLLLVASVSFLSKCAGCLCYSQAAFSVLIYGITLFSLLFVLLLSLQSVQVIEIYSKKLNGKSEYLLLLCFVFCALALAEEHPATAWPLTHYCGKAGARC